MAVQISKSWLSLLILFSLLSTYFYSSISNGQDNKTNQTESNLTIYYFWSYTCPHCKAARPFIETTKVKYPQVTWIEYEVTAFPENAKLFESFAKAHKLNHTGTPTFFIGGKAIIGWRDEETSGKLIDERINFCLNNPESCQDSLKITKGELNLTINESQQLPDYTKVRLPLFGEIDLSKYPLLVIAIVIGLLDGFNPCEMWILVYLITLLALERDRRKMIIIAGSFILASTVLYYLILTAWLNVFSYLSFIEILRMLVGLFAVSAGSYGIYSYYKNRDKPDACEVVSPNERKKIINMIKELTKPQIMPATILGVMFLAVSVNLIEFVCSAGFPAIFTKILADNKLSFWENQFYILVYLFMFEFDDLVIFSIAILTLSAYKETGEKYARLSHFIGSVIMLILGLFLLFWPEALIF
ncbi:MAG: DsbA family protein [Candidatus Micrarchaeota archaeon]|nr:DsbA family protein [Candidatus Micrarchaeota archaeon]